VNDLAEHVKSAALTMVYTAETDPNRLLGRPNGYLSKAAFKDSRVRTSDVEGTAIDDLERGGSVEVFPDARSATSRRDYIQQIGEASPVFAKYDYLSGPVLVRVSRNLTPAQAGDYESALNGSR
jgi:hypothetical protein